MNDDHGLGAMPKLYGAPAYARPPLAPVAPVDRPYDPDDLPIAAERSDEDAELVARLEGRPYASVATTDPVPTTPDREGGTSGTDGSAKLVGRPFRFRLPGRGQAGR